MDGDCGKMPSSKIQVVHGAKGNVLNTRLIAQFMGPKKIENNFDDFDGSESEEDIEVVD